MRTLLGIAAVAALVAWCFARATPQARHAQPEAGDDGGGRRVPPPGRLVHAGDPTVRH